nr:hypothetical protein [uncultured Butyrivibrio sp.]
MADRSDLINQLAASMGAGKFAATSYEETRYDAETGTLYCDGMVISKTIADKAIQHFELLYKKCDIKDSSQREMAMIYKCAVESIKLIENPDVKVFLKDKLFEKQA